MKATNTLRVVKQDEPRESWATDRAYVKPVLTRPEFPIDSEQPKPVSHIKRRIAEINTPKVEPVKRTWWERLFK